MTGNMDGAGKGYLEENPGDKRKYHIVEERISKYPFSLDAINASDYFLGTDKTQEIIKGTLNKKISVYDGFIENVRRDKQNSSTANNYGDCLAFVEEASAETKKKINEAALKLDAEGFPGFIRCAIEKGLLTYDDHGNQHF